MTPEERKYIDFKSFKRALELFCECEVPSEFIYNYMYSGGDDSLLELQDFISSHMKDEISWCTGLGAIEAAEHLIETAMENGNL